LASEGVDNATRKGLLNEDEATMNIDDEMRELRIEDRDLREGITEATAQVERAKRRLDEVALEFMHRGDVVRVAVGARAWTGTIVHVGRSLLTLQTASRAAIDVDLGKVSSIAVVSRSPTGGRSPGVQDPATLIARLRELDGTDEAVEIGGQDLNPVTVHVSVVAQGHVEADGIDGTEWVVPLDAIAYVICEAPSRNNRTR
jgi:hypothetical protein